MRLTAYSKRGRPSDATKTRDQLAMLVQASLVIADTERWALEPSQKSAPKSVADLMEREGAYEVAVVDQFHRTARSVFARAQQYAVWERAFKTGNAGRPEASDIAIFDNSNGGTEIRLELGEYEPKKLKAEAEKLKRLAATVVSGYPNVENYVALWKIREARLTLDTAKQALSRYQSAAAKATKGAVNTTTPFTVTAILASAVDLFTAKDRDASHVEVGVFEVT